jgi:hypothetical protein
MSYVPVKKFGKDHWSLFGYVECCCVDGSKGVGELDPRRIRIKTKTGMLAWKEQYGSRLSGFFDFAERSDPKKAEEAGLQLLNHDDLDCLDDLEEAGFVEVLSTANLFVKMTAKGSEVCGLLRAHKASGKNFSDFCLEPQKEAA